MRREADGRVDERTARNMERVQEGGGREDDPRVQEPRPEVPGPGATNGADQDERNQDHGSDDHGEVADRRPEAGQAAGDDGAPALIQELSEAGMGGDRIPFVDRADPEGGAVRAGRRDGTKDGHLASPPRPHHQQEETEAPDRSPERNRAAILDVEPAAAAAPAAHPSPAIPEPDQPDRGAEEDPVVPAERSEPGQQARECVGPVVPFQTSGGHPDRRRDEGVHDREVFGLGHEDRGGGRDGRENAGRDRDQRLGAGVPGDGPGQRCRERSDQHQRQRRSQRRGSKDRDERHLNEACQRQPVRVRWNRERRDIGDAVAHLREDPDEVHVEAVARGDGPGDIDVVVRIRVGGVGVDGDQRKADQKREHEQRDRGPHGWERSSRGAAVARRRLPLRHLASRPADTFRRVMRLGASLLARGTLPGSRCGTSPAGLRTLSAA